MQIGFCLSRTGCLPTGFFAGTKPLQKIEVTIAKIVIGLVGLWLIAWTPYALVALIGISGHGHLLTPLVTMIPALFAKSAACIDPFVYSLNHPKIKAELFSRFRRLFVSSPRDTNPFSESEHMCSVCLVATTANSAAAIPLTGVIIPDHTTRKMSPPTKISPFDSDR